jgi:hypothetical protein
VARVRWSRVAVVLFSLLAWGLILAPLAHAQSGGFVWSEHSSSQPHAQYADLWNATGSEILAGVVVMYDTTSATVQPQIPLGKGFKTWDANPANVKRVIGVLMENCPGYSKRRILTNGWTNYVKMDASAIAGMTYLRPSLSTAGALGAWASADSTNAAKPIVGQFQRYESTVSLYGYARVNFFGVMAGK